ncbi:MAG: polysaccharide biosynthesis/export family protein [Gemmatimonadaceae bacterium]
MSSPIGQSRQFETRAQLEAQAVAAEKARRTSEAWLLRSRLERGDFQEGDRIVVLIEGTGGVMDTLQVRSGKLLQFPRMGDMSLAGVLRSELTDTVRHHLSKYMNSPAVRATPLLSIAVMGTVVHPGYYYASADVVLRDVIMKAGGPAGSADLNKIVVRRGGDVIWNSEDVRVALTDGLSLDGLHLRAGDEVFVPERRRFQLSTVTAILSTVIALTLAVTQMSQ